MADKASEPRIGWLGTGRMGAMLIWRLLSAGCDVSVYNRTRAKAEPLAAHGAKIVDSVAGLAATDLLFVTVGTPQDLIEAMTGPAGLAAAARPPRGHRRGRRGVQDHGRAARGVRVAAGLGCWDYLANEIPKVRYMTGGQVTVPLVVRTANGGGLGFGAQHSQAVENWALAVPGLKIAAPSTPADVIGLLASAIRSDDPVVFFEHKGLFASKGEAPPDGHVVEPGQAAVARPGSDVTLVALAATVPLALAAADRLAAEGVAAEVIDLRCLVPLDMATVLESVGRTSRLLIVEENPYQGGWGGTVASIAADEGFELLDAPVRRVAAACVPLPFADVLEEQVIPTVESVTAAIRALAAY